MLICREPVEARYKSIMVVHGDRGSGKSTLISNWIQKFKAENREVKVICQYVGCSGRSADISVFLRHCIKELREEYLRPSKLILSYILVCFEAWDNECILKSLSMLIYSWMLFLRGWKNRGRSALDIPGSVSGVCGRSLSGSCCHCHWRTRWDRQHPRTDHQTSKHLHDPNHRWHYQ